MQSLFYRYLFILLGLFFISHTAWNYRWVIEKYYSPAMLGFDYFILSQDDLSINEVWACTTSKNLAYQCPLIECDWDGTQCGQLIIYVPLKTGLHEFSYASPIAYDIAQEMCAKLKLALTKSKHVCIGGSGAPMTVGTNYFIWNFHRAKISGKYINHVMYSSMDVPVQFRHID